MNTTTIILDKANSGTVSGVATFYQNVSENICVGMAVTHGNFVGEVNAIPEGTVITGIEEKSRIVYLNNQLVNNIQNATGNTVHFSYSVIDAPSHGLVAGDILHVSAGTANTTTVSGTYTVFESRDANIFTTVPAMTGVGSATLYSSIFFAERFTNGPYNIQNNGDQIKVTLNISLD